LLTNLADWVAKLPSVTETYKSKNIANDNETGSVFTHYQVKHSAHNVKDIQVENFTKVDSFTLWSFKIGLKNF
jgi:hypothetical protein